MVLCRPQAYVDLLNWHSVIIPKPIKATCACAFAILFVGHVCPTPPGPITTLLYTSELLHCEHFDVCSRPICKFSLSCFWSNFTNIGIWVYIKFTLYLSVWRTNWPSEQMFCAGVELWVSGNEQSLQRAFSLDCKMLTSQQKCHQIWLNVKLVFVRLFAPSCLLYLQ